MRSSSSPPSPSLSRRLSHGEHNIHAQSNLEDSVKQLSITARRRLIKRRSGPARVPSDPTLAGKDIVGKSNLHIGERLSRLFCILSVEARAIHVHVEQAICICGTISSPWSSLFHSRLTPTMQLMARSITCSRVADLSHLLY